MGAYLPEKPIRIAFDVGGVLSKYPGVFIPLLAVLHRTPGVEVYILSDMHPVDKIIDMLELNGINFYKHRTYSADYKTHGEDCKAVLCKELGIDILIDDFIGYVATPGASPVRLLVMPDSSLPYYANEWQTDGSEGDFGRRNPPGSKRPPEGRLKQDV
jgi:hypothetical protein